MHYPEWAKRMGNDSKIWISFIVDKEGCVQNLCIYPKYLKFPESFSKEVDKWSAGIHQGKAVPVRILFPIIICLR